MKMKWYKWRLLRSFLTLFCLLSKLDGRIENFIAVVLSDLGLDQEEDYLVENFSATSGGKFSQRFRNQIFGAYMYETAI